MWPKQRYPRENEGLMKHSSYNIMYTYLQLQFYFIFAFIIKMWGWTYSCIACVYCCTLFIQGGQIVVTIAKYWILLWTRQFKLRKRSLNLGVKWGYQFKKCKMATIVYSRFSKSFKHGFKGSKKKGQISPFEVMSES